MAQRGWTSYLPLAWSRTLAVLLFVDVLVLAVVLVRSPVLQSSVPALSQAFSSESWSIQQDNSYPELYGYAKELAAAVLLVVLAVVTRESVHAAWALVFVVVLLDDALLLHERVGEWTAATLAFPDEVLGVRGRDLGELIGWGLMAAVPLVAVVVAHRRAGTGARALSRALVVLIAALVFFAVVVDQLHVALYEEGQRAGVLGVAEDGGELLVLSVVVAVIVGAVSAERLQPASR